MLKETNLIQFWRAANAALAARRSPGLPMGRANLYWLLQFSPELAADAEMFRGRV